MLSSGASFRQEHLNAFDRDFMALSFTLDRGASRM
jgi:hypothetical protein